MASWVTPSVQAVGDVITAAIWNQNVVDNPTFLYQRPYGTATVPTSEAVTGSFSQLPLSSLIEGYGVTLVSNALVIPIAGLWVVGASAQFVVSSSVASADSTIAIDQNGNDVIYGDAAAFAAGGTTQGRPTCTIPIVCAASDQITLWAKSNLTGSPVVQGPGKNTYLSVIYQGPS